MAIPALAKAATLVRVRAAAANIADLLRMMGRRQANLTNVYLTSGMPVSETPTAVAKTFPVVGSLPSSDSANEVA